MRRYKNGVWTTVSPPNGVNTAQNYVFSNITAFSVFAPMAATNQPPTISNLLLTSSSLTNSTGENLTITYNANDANDDPVKNITIWRVDDNSTTVLDMFFEGGSNATYAKDHSDTGSDAIVAGPTWNVTGGYDGFAAYDFDGTNDWMYNRTRLIEDYPFTISVWVKTTRASQAVAGLYDPQNYNYFHQSILISGGKARAFTNAGTPPGCFSSRVAQGTTTVNDGTWHHLAGVWTNDTHRAIYVDGVLEATNTQYCPFENPSKPLRRWYIGRKPGYSGYVPDLSTCPFRTTDTGNLQQPTIPDRLTGNTRWRGLGSNRHTKRRNHRRSHRVL
jgi:hypothetical protein